MRTGPSRRRPAAAGHALASTLVTLFVVALLCGASSLAIHRQVARQQPLAAARRVVSDLRLRRSQAIARARRLGLVFEAGEGTWQVSLHEDGDGDGIRADDRANGRDPLLEGPNPFDERYGSLGPGFLPDLVELRSPPPGSRLLDSLEDPVRFGRGDVISFGPRGSTTAGTLYLTDGDARQLAVVVHGGRSRVRVWELRPDRQGWVRR